MVVTIKESGSSINDTCVSNKIDIINNNDIDFCTVDLSPTFPVVIKDEVELLDLTQEKIFGGYVRDTNNTELKDIIIFGYDILLQDIQIQKNFESYSPEDIIEYCVEYAGLTFVSTITTGLTIDL